MDSPICSILSDTFTHYFEVRLFETLKFPFHVRYIDNCFMVINHGHLVISHNLLDVHFIDP